MINSKYLAKYSLTLIFIGLILTSCSNKIVLVNSSVVPGAQGYVTIKNDKNNNHSIKLKVTNLARPDMLSPARSEYVVWMRVKDNVSKNIGRLHIEGGTTKIKKASLETVSSEEPLGFFITAEDNGNPTTPGSTVVMETK